MRICADPRGHVLQQGFQLFCLTLHGRVVFIAIANQPWRSHLPDWDRLESRLPVIGCSHGDADAGVNAGGVVSVVEIIRITVATGSIERILFDFTGRLRAAVHSGQIALAV
jgi:hypothetical protein